MKNKIIYWVATGLVSLMMLFCAYAYFTDSNVSAGFTAMGFKDFFRIELGIAKVLGAFVLIIPAAPRLIKEWAYAGFGITFISTFITYAANGDSASSMVMPLGAACHFQGISYKKKLENS